MEISLTTPALLFPAVSLLLVAYTNKFLSLGARIRTLSAQYRQHPEHPDDIIVRQLDILKRRVLLIRNMQFFGVGSIFFCVLCMFAFFAGLLMAGKILFGICLLLMLISLGLSLVEISISFNALNMELANIKKIHSDNLGGQGKQGLK